MPSWWQKAPWADRERPGIQMFWVSAFLSALAIIIVLVERLF